MSVLTTFIVKTIQSYPTLPYPTLSYPTLPYRTLRYPTLSYPILSYPTLSYRGHSVVVSSLTDTAIENVRNNRPRPPFALTAWGCPCWGSIDIIVQFHVHFLFVCQFKISFNQTTLDWRRAVFGIYGGKKGGEMHEINPNPLVIQTQPRPQVQSPGNAVDTDSYNFVANLVKGRRVLCPPLQHRPEVATTRQ